MAVSVQLVDVGRFEGRVRIHVASIMARRASSRRLSDSSASSVELVSFSQPRQRTCSSSPQTSTHRVDAGGGLCIEVLSSSEESDVDVADRLQEVQDAAEPPQRKHAPACMVDPSLLALTHNQAPPTQSTASQTQTQVTPALHALSLQSQSQQEQRDDIEIDPFFYEEAAYALSTSDQDLGPVDTARGPSSQLAVAGPSSPKHKPASASSSSSPSHVPDTDEEDLSFFSISRIDKQGKYRDDSGFNPRETLPSGPLVIPPSGTGLCRSSPSNQSHHLRSRSSSSSSAAAASASTATSTSVKGKGKEPQGVESSRHRTPLTSPAQQRKNKHKRTQSQSQQPELTLSGPLTVLPYQPSPTTSVTSNSPAKLTSTSIRVPKKVKAKGSPSPPVVVGSASDSWDDESIGGSDVSSQSDLVPAPQDQSESEESTYEPPAPDNSLQEAESDSEVEEEEPVVQVKRRRGRPKGSPNKRKNTQSASTQKQKKRKSVQRAPSIESIHLDGPSPSAAAEHVPVFAFSHTPQPEPPPCIPEPATIQPADPPIDPSFAFDAAPAAADFDLDALQMLLLHPQPPTQTQTQSGDEDMHQFIDFDGGHAEQSPSTAASSDVLTPRSLPSELEAMTAHAKAVQSLGLDTSAAWLASFGYGDSIHTQPEMDASKVVGDLEEVLGGM